MSKYAICDDCKEPIKNIFGIYDYVDLELKEHTVCRKCIDKWINSIGKEKAKNLIFEFQNNKLYSSNSSKDIKVKEK